MQRAKAFFFVCAGVFLLALAYHLGATSATAQAPSNSVVASIPCGVSVVTANGDVYNNPLGGACPLAPTWVHAGNVFTGGPTPAAQPTFGQLKAQYRK